jgi:hypothetical protein
MVIGGVIWGTVCRLVCPWYSAVAGRRGGRLYGALLVGGPIVFLEGLWAEAAAPYALPRSREQFQQIIRSPSSSYAIHVGGTLDEFNTAYYPVAPTGYARLESRFQPNSYLMIENQGTTRIENARLTINGRRDWSSVDAILNSVIAPGMSDADKALAMFHHTADLSVQTHDNNTRVGPELPALGQRPANEFRELADPVKATNIYYSNGCSTAAANLAILSRHAGLDAHVLWLSPSNHLKTHAVAEVFYDGGWHVFDPDSRAYFLEEDGRTVASYQTLHERPWLVDATHLGGFASPGLDLKLADEFARNWPPPEMPVDTDWVSSLELDLRPREKFIWRWTDDNKFRWGDNPRNRGTEPPQLANGKLVYEPKLDAWSRAADASFQSQLRERPTGVAGNVVLTPAAANQPATLVYEIESPYPIVGGTIGGTFQKYAPSDLLRLSISTDGQQWQTALDAPLGHQTRYAAIDEVLPPETADAIYRYFIKADLRGSTNWLPSLEGLYFETDVQMAEPALPSLSVGHNQVVYRSDSSGPQQVRITHGWQESAATTPPPAPNQLRVRGGTDSLRLTWNQRPDADREPVVDYQVQVSDDAGMQFPLGSNFDRLLFSGGTEWSIPRGAFRPFEDYFFRVRGRDRWGAWSDWSDPLQLIYDPFASRDAQRVIGDANLDGRFTSADLVQVFQRGQYEDRKLGNSRWTDGDWNGDLEFNSRDMVELLLSGEVAGMTARFAVAVPEPAPLTLGAMAVLWGLNRRSQRAQRGRCTAWA